VPRASHPPVARDARLGRRRRAEQPVLSPPWLLVEEQHSFYDTLVSHPNATVQPPGPPTPGAISHPGVMAAPVGLYVHFRARRAAGRILCGGAAGRSFGWLRLDLWLPIDPSASDTRAGYIFRPALSTWTDDYYSNGRDARNSA
jgi:hypothetical protein